jgi:HSP20 family protein
MLWDTLTFNDLDEMRRDIDALGEMLGTNGAYQSSFPSINAYENHDEITLAVFVPGIEKKDLEIRCENDTVTLIGGRDLPFDEGPDRRYLRHEREHGKFEKAFRLPAKVVSSEITAKLENGILFLRAPKSEESKPKQINIQTR